MDNPVSFSKLVQQQSAAADMKRILVSKFLTKAAELGLSLYEVHGDIFISGPEEKAEEFRKYLEEVILPGYKRPSEETKKNKESLYRLLYGGK